MVRKYLYYKLKRTKLPYYPDRLYIEATNICNLKCPMCPTGRGDMKRPEGFMDFNFFKKIIDEMSPHIKTVVLHIWGESLMDKRIFDKISYAKGYDVKTELSTNVTLLDAKITRNIFDSGLDVIYLCLDGVTKETYEGLRKGANFELVTSNISYLLTEKKERNLTRPYVNLQIVDMKATHGEIEKFRKRWSIQGVENINVKSFDTWGGQIDAITELKEKAEDVAEKRFHCPNLWYHAHIYWDGTLVACDRDFNAAYPLGNVKDGVMKVWNGAKMRKLREKHLKDDLEDVPSCSKCVEWSWWKPTAFSSWGNIPKKG
ncbi:MAG: SPASM domain-containing protein [Candidatus Altiarchaeota archaeon]